MSHSRNVGDSLQAAERVLDEFLMRREAGESVDFESVVRSHPRLEAALRELQAAVGDIAGVLEKGRAEHTAEQARVDALLGQIRFGVDPGERYTLESEIGKGGMGVVYRVRDTKLDRPLAMKVILGQADVTRTGKTPPIAARQLARFVNEAKITGQLDHPGIVPVHEVGVDQEGRAFFTMKLVKGITLAEVFELRAANEPEWSMPRVLNVIQRVCEAMAFAHERGVIHRDLKPQNIMVGDFGEVYVMDWGLARRVDEAAGDPGTDGAGASTDVDAELLDEVSITRDGAIVGTPSYMSPEQARGQIAAMGPPSDVYAIGAMLYQLIAGHAPFTNPGEKASSAQILARVVTSEPAKLVSRTTPPELIAICEKAMSREAGARYTDLRELAEDLGRFLSGRSVRALKTGTWAETKKWVRRNRALAGSLATTFVVLIVGVITSLLYAGEANAARSDLTTRNAELTEAKILADRSAQEARANEQRANDNAKEAQASEGRTRRVLSLFAGVFKRADVSGAGRADELVIDAVERAEQLLDDGTMDVDPRSRAELAGVMGSVLLSHGRTEGALRLAEHALADARIVYPGDHQDVARAMSNVAQCELELAHYERALESGRSAFEMHERGGYGDSPELASALDTIGVSLQALGSLDESLRWKLQALEVRRRLQPGDDRDVATSLNSVGSTQASLGNHEAALESFQAGQEMLTRLIPGDHPLIAASDSNVATALMSLGRSEEALPLLERSLSMYARIYPGDHQDVALGHSNLGDCLAELGRLDEAVQEHELAIAIYKRVLPVPHPLLAYALGNLANVLRAQGRYGLALPFVAEALDIYFRVYPDDQEDVARGLGNLGTALQDVGRFDEALPALTASLEVRMSLYPDGHDSLVKSLNNVASCWHQLGDVGRAMEMYEEGLQMESRLHDAPTEAIARFHNNIGFLLQTQGRLEDAVESHCRSLEISRSLHAGDADPVALSLNNIGTALLSMRDPRQALPYLLDALAMYQRLFQGSHPLVARGFSNVAVCLARLDRLPEAASYAQDAEEMAKAADLLESHPLRVSIAGVKKSIDEKLNSLRRLGEPQDVSPR